MNLRSDRDPSHGVFLTGATGFLGAFLLDALLARKTGPVYCLVRARDTATGLERILAAQDAYGLSGRTHVSRIHAVPGELQKPGLGIDPSLRLSLIQVCATFLHVAASTNFLFGAPFLKGPNLEGTRGVIALAQAARSQTGQDVVLHYVSSASIFLSGRYGGQVVGEAQAPAEGDLRPAWGYQLTKWQGEQLVQAAAASGIRVGVSRPWFIGPHSQTGVASDHDFMLRVFQGCLALGMAPELDLVVQIMPVDWVVNALLTLVFGGGEGPWYLGNPQQTSFAQVVAQLARHAPVETVPYARWRAALRASPDNPAWIFLPLFPEQYDPEEKTSFLRRMCRDTIPEVFAPKSQAQLEHAGTCPPFHGEVLERWLCRLGLKAG